MISADQPLHSTTAARDSRTTASHPGDARGVRQDDVEEEEQKWTTTSGHITSTTKGTGAMSGKHVEPAALGELSTGAMQTKLNVQQQQKQHHQQQSVGQSENDENVRRENFNHQQQGFGENNAVRKPAFSSASASASARRSVRGGKLGLGMGRRPSVSAESFPPAAQARQQQQQVLGEVPVNDENVPCNETRSHKQQREQQMPSAKVMPVPLQELDLGTTKESKSSKRKNKKKKKQHQQQEEEGSTWAEEKVHPVAAAAAAGTAQPKVGQTVDIAPQSTSSGRVGWRTSPLVVVLEIFVLVGAVALALPWLPSLDDGQAPGGQGSSRAGGGTASVAAPPVVVSKPFFHAVNTGEPFGFELELGADEDTSEGDKPAVAFQWRLNGVNLAEAKDRRLSIPRAEARHSGTYSCVVSNEAGRVVWEEGYLNVVDDSQADGSSVAAEPSAPTLLELERRAKRGDSAQVRQVRACLLRLAPDAIMRAASVDGGAAVIAAGESTGFLQCFPALQAALRDDPGAARQGQVIELLRSLHGQSKKRSLLVNVLSALDDLARAKADMRLLPDRPLPALDQLVAEVAFHAGVFCASTPQCATANRTDKSTADPRQAFSRTILQALR